MNIFYKLKLAAQKNMPLAVEEEYRIYDFFAMVGSIGGSLGLCVGFSIFDTFSMIIDKVFST